MNKNTTHSDPTKRLVGIRNHLDSIGEKVNSLLRQLGTSPQMASTPNVSPSGRSRRLTDEEENDIVRMLRRPDLYTVQEIASKHVISRPSVYNIRDKRCPEVHTRGSQALITV